MTERLGRFAKLSIILVGAIVLSTNPATTGTAMAAEQSAGNCIWCFTNCPSNLIDFCTNTQCPNQNATCTSGSGCQGVNGHWYDYKVSCAAA